MATDIDWMFEGLLDIPGQPFKEGFSCLILGFSSVFFSFGGSTVRPDEKSPLNYICIVYTELCYRFHL